jgi:hypothetical protein
MGAWGPDTYLGLLFFFLHVSLPMEILIISFCLH